MGKNKRSKTEVQEKRKIGIPDFNSEKIAEKKENMGESSKNVFLKTKHGKRTWSYICAAILFVAVLLYVFCVSGKKELTSDNGKRTVTLKQCVVDYNGKSYFIKSGDYVVVDNQLLIPKDTIINNKKNVINDTVPYSEDLRKNEMLSKDKLLKIYSVQTDCTKVFRVNSNMMFYSIINDKCEYEINGKQDSLLYLQNEWWALEKVCEKHTRPLFKKEQKLYHPQSRINPKDLIIDQNFSHKPVLCVDGFRYGKKLFVKFNPEDSVNNKNLRIFEQYQSLSSPKESKDFEGYYEVNVKDTLNCLYRVSAKEGVSYYIEAPEIPTVVVNLNDPEKAAKNDSSSSSSLSWWVWLALGMLVFFFLLAIIELLFILNIFRIKKRTNSVEKDSKRFVEEINWKIQEKKKEIANKQQELLNYENKIANLRKSSYNWIVKSLQDDVLRNNRAIQDFYTSTVIIAWEDWQKCLSELKESNEQNSDFLEIQDAERKAKKTYKRLEQEIIQDIKEEYERKGVYIKMPSESQDYINDSLQNWEKCQTHLVDDIDALKKDIIALQGQIKSIENSQDENFEERYEDVEKLKQEVQKAQKDLEDFRANFDKKLNEKEIRIRKDADKDIQIAKREADDANRRAERADEKRREAEKTSREIEERVKQSFESIINKFKDDIDSQKNEINKLSSKLHSTSDDLTNVQRQLQTANQTIEDKERALSGFKKKITDVQPAGNYAKIIEVLLQLGAKIETSADKLLDIKGIDDYLITKYIARYHASLRDININQFAADVLNVANVQFVYNTQPLASYNQQDRMGFDEATKEYFFSTYLKKYVDALFVLNETMAGVYYLVDGLDAQASSAFVNYRAELNALMDKLEIKVLSARIFEPITDNIDLQAEMRTLDYDCPVGTICQINNCIVFRKGANKPNEKISVIVKK